MASITALAQKRVKHKESGKFVWYSLEKDGIIEVQNKKKETIIPFSVGCKKVKYDSSSDVFLVNVNNYIGVYNKEGEEIIAPNKYTEIEPKYEFNIQKLERYYYFLVKVNVAFEGICNAQGEEIIPPDKYTNISLDKYSEEFEYYFKVNRGQFAGICNTKGEEIIAPNKYTSVYSVYDKDFGVYFHVAKDGLYGICNAQGEEVIAPNKYKGVYPRYDKDFGVYFRVEKDGLDGICNAQGEEIIPPIVSGTITYNNGCFCTYSATGYQPINPDFTPKDGIIAVGKKYRIVNVGGSPINKLLYDNVTYSSESGKYEATISGYTTTVGLDGKENDPIGEQIFNEAYDLPDSEYQQKYDLYTLLLQIDPNNAYGYNAAAYNNIGVIYRKAGDNSSALQYYRKSLAISPNDETAKNNIAIIEEEENARRKAEKAERMNKISEALGNLSQTLNNINQSNNYNQNNYNQNNYNQNNYNQDSYNQDNSSGSDNNNYQIVYDDIAQSAEWAYKKIVKQVKNGKNMSDRSLATDVNFYRKTQRRLQSISRKARAAGKPVQESIYQTKSIDF